MALLSLTCLLALILLIWFRTEAWLEYCKLLHLDFISFYKDFEERKRKNITWTYHHFLRMYHGNFFVRLVTCPICFSVWLGLGFSLFLSISQAPIIIIGGLLLFVTIDKLLG